MSYFGKKLLTTSEYIPTVIGEAYGGGFYAGRLRVNNQAYVVVVSPIAAFNSSIAFASVAGKELASFSPWDGNANHNRMVAEGLSNYPAAQYCAGLTTGGFTDWHVPAEFEQDICYRAFRLANAPSTSVGANQYADPPKGNYTSSDPAATTLPLFVSGGEQAYTANLFLTSSPGNNTTTVQLMNFNGGTRVGSATNTARMLRPTRLVRVSR